MASNEYNHIQMLTFLFGGIALSALIVKIVYIKMDEYTAYKQKQKALGSGWKVIRPELTQEEVSKLLLNIEEFNETWSNLNSDFIAGDKNAKGDFTKQFNELYKSYLELLLKSESIINDKKDGLAPKNLKTKQLKNYLERLKSKKQSMDILKEDIQMQEQSTQSGSLNFLTIANAIFLPMGAMIGFFGMNFSKMDKDGAFASFLGPNATVKQAHLMMWCALLLVAIIVAIILKFYFMKGSVSNFQTMGDSSGEIAAYDENNDDYYN